MSEGPHGLVNTTWRSRKDKYRVNFFFFSRRLLDRLKSQQSRTLVVTILVHLGNYLRNLLCGHCFELIEAALLAAIFYARYRSYLYFSLSRQNWSLTFSGRGQPWHSLLPLYRIYRPSQVLNLPMRPMLVPQQQTVQVVSLFLLKLHESHTWTSLLLLRTDFKFGSSDGALQ